jgi:hypothetical protein
VGGRRRAGPQFALPTVGRVRTLCFSPINLPLRAGHKTTTPRHGPPPGCLRQQGAGRGRCCPTGLALEIPDMFLATVAAVANEGVDLVIGDAIVKTAGVGTSKPRCSDPLLAEWATWAFYWRIRLEGCRRGWAAWLGDGAPCWTVVRCAWFEWVRRRLGMDSMGGNAT